MEVYVDDTVVKFNIVEQHLTYLTEIFAQIRKHDMRLTLKNGSSK